MVKAIDHLVPIGQFSKLTWLSAKSLRRYADSGLLPPARIDPDTGYRYYRLSQIECARMIRLLRMREMSLAALGTLLLAILGLAVGSNRRVDLVGGTGRE